MNKQILISLSIIGAVAAIAIGGTVAYFSDTETSGTNTITAGIVDIVVDGQNPWSDSYSETLQDMKPSQTRYIDFTIRNLEDSNEVKVWKRINIVSQEDGTVTEPECSEGGGEWIWDSGTETGTCGTGYVERNNLAAYTIYDMSVCADPDVDNCLTDAITGAPTGNDWTTKIDENQFVRLDNIGGAWIYLGQLSPAKELKVVQSYHLRSWPDAPEPEVGNWAQGDVLTFDIDLYAEQLEGPGPEGEQVIVDMVGKNPTTWEEIEDGSGTLAYNTSGPTFDYEFNGSGLGNIEYCLIYYADPWPGNHPGALINRGTPTSGSLSLNGSYDFGYDLPNASDQNAPAGAKIWLVPCTDYNELTNSMTAWSPSTYLFDTSLITYDDTDF